LKSFATAPSSTQIPGPQDVLGGVSQVTAAPTVQVPSTQWSSRVQPFPSALHAVPFAALAYSQAAVTGLHTGEPWHTPWDTQVPDTRTAPSRCCGAPLPHTPAVQVSPAVQALPSSQAVPFALGV
jgi:hypothetical protein